MALRRDYHSTFRRTFITDDAEKKQKAATSTTYGKLRLREPDLSGVKDERQRWLLTKRYYGEISTDEQNEIVKLSEPKAPKVSAPISETPGTPAPRRKRTAKITD